MEEWKDIVGWEGIYQVSSYGRLKSFKRDSGGRILLNTNKTGWYLNVVLRVGSKKTDRMWSIKMHQLVAMHFLPPKPSLKHVEVNHKDGNKQNNNVENLEWVTRHENMLHAARTMPSFLDWMHLWNKVLKTKRICQFTLDGELVATHLNGTEAALKSGVCQRNILQVAGKTEYKPGLTRKQAGGFRWIYEEEVEEWKLKQSEALQAETAIA
jgi:hypothetical protein